MKSTASKITSRDAVPALMHRWHLKNERVVFTNGCFDILHLGHIDYLERAKMLGTKLIVGLNSDTSVRELKGEGRPIQDEQARARLLAALQFVDAVVIFGEETPRDLIVEVGPDVLVKGNDYQIEEIAGAKEVLAAGGEVKTVSLVDGYSTTNIVQQMKGS